MKKVIPILLLLFSPLFIGNIIAQADCAKVLQASFILNTDPGNPCKRSVSFNYINPTEGEKRLYLQVTSGGSTLLTECIDITKHKGEPDNFSYTSAFFILCNSSGLTVSITPYNSNNCLSVPCAASTISLMGSTLPVALTSFTASRSKEKVILQWETAIEISSQGFAIEKKYADDWQQVAFVNSQAAGGNSNGKLNYQYNDRNTNKGITQYRIRTEDMNGDHHYSEVRAVKGDEQDTRTSIFPTPSNDGKVTVLFGSNETRNISLLDISGKVVQNWNGYSPNTLIISDLKQGIYLLCYANRSGGKRLMERIIVSGQ